MLSDLPVCATTMARMEENMNNDNLINDIIKMLDSSMENGTGHVNIEVDSDNTVRFEKIEQGDEDLIKTVETLKCTDCSKGNLACGVPTLHEGLDSKE